MNHVVERSPQQKAIRLEAIRTELEPQGFTIVSTEWLCKLNEAILKRKLMEEVQ